MIDLLITIAYFAAAFHAGILVREIKNAASRNDILPFYEAWIYLQDTSGIVLAALSLLVVLFCGVFGPLILVFTFSQYFG